MNGKKKKKEEFKSAEKIIKQVNQEKNNLTKSIKSSIFKKPKIILKKNKIGW